MLSVDQKKFQLHIKDKISANTCVFLDFHGFNQAFQVALEKCCHNFSHIRNKRYSWESGAVLFNPLHTGQYSVFLYYLSHAIKKTIGNEDLADAVYGLNKTLHSIDIHPDVKLPNVFYLEHPVGTVLGKASYSNFFQCRQNCTVGNKGGVFPRFGENVHLWSGVSVIGNCEIGSNVVIGAGSLLIDQDIPSNSIVYGRVKDIVVKHRSPVAAYDEWFKS